MSTFIEVCFACKYNQGYFVSTNQLYSVFAVGMLRQSDFLSIHCQNCLSLVRGQVRTLSTTY